MKDCATTGLAETARERCLICQYSWSGNGFWIGSSIKLSGKATGHILLWASLVFPDARNEALGVPAKERVAGISDTRLDCRARTDPGGWGLNRYRHFVSLKGSRVLLLGVSY
jgi:hypothetical protein